MANDVSNMGSAQTVSNSGHFSDYEFVPAVIVETDDPLKYGRIKVTALGAFNANTSTPEQLPWCYPFTMQGNNSFASYEKGSKVWIIRNKKRQDENWFIPMYEHHGMTQQFVNNTPASDKPEVVSMRNKGGSQSSITYDHSGGYSISSGGSGGGGGAAVNVGTNGTTTVSGGGSSVSVADGKVELGNPGEDPHPAVLGDKLMDFLVEAFLIFIDFLAELGASDPQAADAVLNTYEKIAEFAQSPEFGDWISKTVTINETTDGDKAKKELEKIEAEQKAEQEKAQAKQAEIEKKFDPTTPAEDRVKWPDGTPIDNYTLNDMKLHPSKYTTNYQYDPETNTLNYTGPSNPLMSQYSQPQTTKPQTTTQQTPQVTVSQTTANNYKVDNTAVSDQTSI